MEGPQQLNKKRKMKTEIKNEGKKAGSGSDVLLFAGGPTASGGLLRAGPGSRPGFRGVF